MRTTDQPQPGDILTITDEGILGHIRAASYPWVLLDRRADSTEPSRVLAKSRRKVAARLRAQELRVDLEPGHVLDIAEWVISGWRLVETLPRLHAGSVEGSKEIVWGHTAQPIAFVEFAERGGWWLWMPADDSGSAYAIPDRRSDGLHFTRDEAVAAARRLADDQPTDDVDWPDRWQRAGRVTRAASNATLIVPIQFLGPTGLVCGYPGCEQEAETRVSAAGSDIAGEQARMCCYDHAGVVSAPIIRPAT